MSKIKRFTSSASNVAEEFFSDNIKEVDSQKNNLVEIQGSKENSLLEKVNVTKRNEPKKSVNKTFTFLQSDLDNIVVLTDKYLDMKQRVNQSEILRMGIAVMLRLNSEELLKELSLLERNTLGRKSLK